MESPFREDFFVAKPRLHSTPLGEQSSNHFEPTGEDNYDGDLLLSNAKVADLRGKLLASEGKKVELTKRLKILEEILTQTELRCEVYLKEKRDLETNLFNAKRNAFEATCKLKGLQFYFVNNLFNLAFLQNMKKSIKSFVKNMKLIKKSGCSFGQIC